MGNSNNKDDLFLKKPGFSLFDTTPSQKLSQLKSFIHFLSSQKLKRPYRFAFVSEEGPLLSNMTVAENISLGASHLSNTNSRLSLFSNQLINKHAYPHQIDNQSRKIAALIKAFKGHHDFLFLESPEKYLSEENIQILIQVLLEEKRKKKTAIFIRSFKRSLWSSHISQVITRDHRQNFTITPYQAGYPRGEFQEGLKIYQPNFTKKAA